MDLEGTLAIGAHCEVLRTCMLSAERTHWLQLRYVEGSAESGGEYAVAAAAPGDEDEHSLESEGRAERTSESRRENERGWSQQTRLYVRAYEEKRTRQLSKDSRQRNVPNDRSFRVRFSLNSQMCVPPLNPTHARHRFRTHTRDRYCARSPVRTDARTTHMCQGPHTLARVAPADGACVRTPAHVHVAAHLHTYT